MKLLFHTKYIINLLYGPAMFRTFVIEGPELVVKNGRDKATATRPTAKVPHGIYREQKEGMETSPPNSHHPTGQYRDCRSGPCIIGVVPDYNTDRMRTAAIEQRLTPERFQGLRLGYSTRVA